MRRFQAVLILATLLVAHPAQSQTLQQVNDRQAAKIKGIIDASTLPADLKGYFYTKLADANSKAHDAESNARTLDRLEVDVPNLQNAYNGWAKMLQHIEDSKDSPPKLREYYLGRAKDLRKFFPANGLQSYSEVASLQAHFDSYAPLIKDIKAYTKTIEGDAKLPAPMKSQVVAFLNAIIDRMGPTQIRGDFQSFDRKKTDVTNCRYLLDDFDKLEQKIYTTAPVGYPKFIANSKKEIANYRVDVCNSSRATGRDSYDVLRRNYDNRLDLIKVAARIQEQIMKFYPENRPPYQARLDKLVPAVEDYHYSEGPDRDRLQRLLSDAVEAGRPR